MAQAMLNYKPVQISHSTQTGDIIEFFEFLAPTKSMHFRYSPRYKDYVLCLYFSNHKKYIITRSMWKKFRTKIFLINYVYDNTKI